MAELEAITILLPSEEEKRCNPDAQQRQIRTRYSLPLNQSIRLGQRASDADCVIAEDKTISRFHATLRWDGTSLSIRERPPRPPKYPKAPTNPIHFRGMPVHECTLLPGEIFTIGYTHFVLCEEGKHFPFVSEPMIPYWEQYFSRTELEKIAFNNPAVILKALEKLPDVLRVATNEQALFRQMLKILVNALPRVDLAGVVSASISETDSQPLVNIREYLGWIPGSRSLANIPPQLTIDRVDEANPDTLNSKSSIPGMIRRNDFNPVWSLVHRAVNEKKSILDFWSLGVDSMTLDRRHLTSTMWAICSPIQDGSRDTVYVAGWYPHPDASNHIEAIKELTSYQKVVELIVGLLEVTRQTHQLTRENTILRQGLPQRLSRLINDPNRLKELLIPRETDVTVMFCDLRSYSSFVETEEADLMFGWEKVASALNSMSRSITLCDGVVARIQGDAVLGYWGWPDGHEQQILDAVRAAVQIQAELNGRNHPTKWKCGLGLAHGRAVVGRLGAHDLAELDLYGPVVNQAARLESMTKAFGVDILVTEEVAKFVALADPSGIKYRIRILGKVRSKGMKNRFVVYELMPSGIPRAKEAVLASWNEALDWFIVGRWSEAYERLEDFFPDDPAAQCLMRIMDRSGRLTPNGWDGSFHPIPPEEDSNI